MLHRASANSLLSSLFAGRLKHRLYLFAILAIALWLRLHEIGEDPYWFDEIGIIRVAEAPSLPDVLGMARNHVAAMPLDYVVTWLIARAFGTGTGVLRLPAAVWGSLAVLAAYLLFARMDGRRVGLVTALLLALSPLHIRYSQELRFYSALVFFYLLANLLLLRALERPTHRRWLAFTLAALVGIFFHVYVAFTFLNAAIWMLLMIKQIRPERQELLKFFFYSLLTLELAFAGVRFFASPNEYYAHPLLEYTPSLLKGIGHGLGWAPVYAGAGGLGYVSSGLCLLLGIIGVARSLWKNPSSKISALVYSAAAQVVLVLLADIWQDYFFAYRQLIFLLPVSLFFAASGLSSTTGWLDRKVTQRSTLQTGIRPGLALAFVLVLVFLGTSLPSLREYYASSRSHIPQISAAVQENWQTGAKLLVLPAHEALSLDYYLEEQHAPLEIDAAMEGVSWTMIEEIEPDDSSLLLVTYPSVSEEKETALYDLGFKPVPVHLPAANQAVNYLWLRTNGNKVDFGVELPEAD